MNKNPHSATTLLQEMGLSADSGITARSHKLKTLKFDTNNKQKKHNQNTIDMLRLDKDLEFFSFSSSSSHSSSPGFSSSDCESILPRSNMDFCFPPIKQKQSRTSTTTVQSQISKPHQTYSYCSVQADREIPLRYESKALNMYTDLKNSKLPISPGSKLARFFNSMLNRKQCGTRATATNLSHKVAMDNLKCKSQLSDTSSPSSSSTTRSCLVKKTPSMSSDKSVKKSVRFYPTNVENSVDIRSRNAEHSPDSMYKRKDENLRFPSIDDHRGGATELVMDEDDIDDAASDTSSELFEIDHIIFGAVSSSKNNCNELPVFETTTLNGSNRAISNAEIVF